MSDRDYYRLYKKYKKKYLQLSAGAETESNPCDKCVTDYDKCIKYSKRSLNGVLTESDSIRCNKELDRCEQEKECY